MDYEAQAAHRQQTNLFINLALGIIGIGIGWLVGLSVSPVVSTVIASITGIAAAIVAALSGLEVKANIQQDKVEVTAATQQNKAEVANVLGYQFNVDPWPLAALIVGIFFGSVAGMLARNHDLLGTGIPIELKQWTHKELTGLSDAAIARRLFELEHPYRPYAEDLSWMQIDAAKGITAALASEVELWHALGLEKAEVTRRLFEIKYPLSNALTAATNTNTSNGTSAFPPQTSTVLFADEQEAQTECERLSGVPTTSKLREAVSKLDNQVFQALAEVLEDPATLRKAVDKLCELAQS